jgi:hypothetical protein
MAKFWLVGGSLLIGALLLNAAPRALAAVAPGVSATGTCVALDDTCAAVDSTFTPLSAMVSLKTSTTGSMTCTGTTTTLPTKATTCEGEKLGGSSEGDPTQPCTMTVGAATLITDDWTETVSKSGKVKITCNFGGSDPK